MTDDGRRVVVEAEIARAREELAACTQLQAIGFARIALTRAYFALFHALRALLYAEGYEPKSHRGALSLFGLHFVRTGRYPTAHASQLSRMQKYREDADYAEGFVPDPAAIAAEIAGAERLMLELVTDATRSLDGPPPA